MWVNLREYPGTGECKYDPDLSKRTRLFLLRCVRNDNRNPPETGNLYRTFEENGWKNENEQPDVKALMNGILSRLVNVYFARHVQAMHRFGKLVSDAGSQDSANMVGKKVLRSDFSNIDRSRARNLYPYKTTFMNVDGRDRTVVSGQCRQYENGLMEYDIVFRLGFVGRADSDGMSVDVLSCNDVAINTYVGGSATARTRTDNAQYFLSRNDYSIFRMAAGDAPLSSVIDDTVQGNRNDYVNTYSGTIEFPVPFVDRNYMIFASDVTCQDRDVSAATVTPSQNAMAWVNKSQRSVTPMYIVFEDASHDAPGYNSTRSGLVSNSFHCRIVGKWK